MLIVCMRPQEYSLLHRKYSPGVGPLDEHKASQASKQPERCRAMVHKQPALAGPKVHKAQVLALTFLEKLSSMASKHSPAVRRQASADSSSSPSACCPS